MYKIYTIDFVVPKRQLQKTLRIMRWTTLFLLVGLLQVSAASLAQRVTMKKQNASLESVLQEIHRQSGFDIVYDLEVVNKAKPVSVDLKDVTVQVALASALSGRQLYFEVDNKKIIIREKSLIDKIKDELPVSVDIRCVITDSLGNTLPGASAYVKYSKVGYLADAKGEFVVPNVSDAGIVLVVSYVGYKTEEVYFNNRDKSPFKIVMKSSMNRLNEVNVVYDGYQKISKERAAGAYASVDHEELQATPSANLMERLVGKMPGVNFDLKSNTIQVRGVNDYSIVGQPLIVVDGFPLISPNDQPQITTPLTGVTGNAIINRFNPDDIEQITVLKDASATSIWGSRGAGGVIVIETRKGKKGMPVLNVNYTLGVTQRPNLNQLAWMNSSQYIDFEQELVNRGILTDPALAPSYNAIYTPNNSDATEWMFRVKRGTATPAQRDAALAELSTHDSRQQINKYLLQNSVTQQANISVSGGAENTTYSVSGNYTKNIPFYKSNYGETFYLNTNVSSGLFNKHLIFHTGLNYQYDNTQYNGAAIDALSNTTTSLRPYDNLVDANGNHIQRTYIFRQSIADSLVRKGYLPFSYNALDELNYSNTVNKTNNFRVTAGLTGKFTNWLNADVSVMSQRQVLGMVGVNELNSYANRIQLNTATSVASNGQLVYGLPYGGTYYEGNNSAYDTGVRGQLNFDHTFKQDHQVTALLGTEIRETGSKATSSTRYGFNQDANSLGPFNPSVPYMTLYGYSQTLTNNLSGISETRRRYLSYYGNAGYSFKDKYFATGSFRFDDATLVGVSRSVRARPFWSTGLRWNATKEDFLNNISWLSNLALRGSYGISGTIPTVGTNITVISVGNLADNRTGLTAAAINTPANASLKWSTTRQINLGTDFNLFKGRLIGSFDIYNKKTDGIVRNLPFNATYGWSSLYYNTAKMTGHGIDLGITGEIIKSSQFHWSSTINFSYTTNKITDERFETQSGTLVSGSPSVNGLPVGAQFVYRWAGLDNQGQSQIYDRNGKVISANTSILNFTRADLRYAGVTYPPYTGGFFNTFTMGPFTATVQMAYYFGSVFLRQSVNTNNYPTSGNSQFYGSIGKTQDMAYRWRQPGDEAITNVPGIQYSSFNSIYRYQYSDALLEKGDHIRLQQVGLNYNVPTRLLPKNAIKALSIGANVQNLGIIWRANKDHLDPLFTNTANYANLPPAKTYLLRLNASF